MIADVPAQTLAERPDLLRVQAARLPRIAFAGSPSAAHFAGSGFLTGGNTLRVVAALAQ